MRILTVCLGNICRSPAAAAVLRAEAARAGIVVEVDSAGTGRYHIGDPPHPRSRATGRRRGFDVDGEARQVTDRDFDEFDLILAMDRSNLDDLLSIAPSAAAAGKVRLLRSFDPDADGPDVPDPYYGTDQDYERMFDLIVPAARGVMRELGSGDG